MDVLKLKGIEANVYQILTNDEKCREDDFVLYATYIEKHRPELRDMGFMHLFNFHNQYNLPSYESITRARRKLQATYEDLKASKAAQERKDDNERAYIAYASGEC